MIKIYAVKNHEHIFEDSLDVVIDEDNDTIDFYHSSHHKGEVCFYKEGTRTNPDNVCHAHNMKDDV